jgi:hypothetical protein
MVMPSPQQLFPVLFDLPVNLAQLTVSKTLRLGKPALRQPEFGLASPFADMNMRWLALVQAEEQELIPFPSEDRRHPKSSSEHSAVDAASGSPCPKSFGGGSRLRGITGG